MAREPRQAAPWPYDIAQPLEECSRDELLWTIRTGLEGHHRHMIHLYAVILLYRPLIQHLDTQPLPEMSITDFLDTCNKSVPVYILLGQKANLLTIVLHNYIYRRWFRPY